ncbi:protein of unknown function [Streptomyces murinus]
MDAAAVVGGEVGARPAGGLVEREVGGRGEGQGDTAQPEAASAVPAQLRKPGYLIWHEHSLLAPTSRNTGPPGRGLRPLPYRSYLEVPAVKRAHGGSGTYRGPGLTSAPPDLARRRRPAFHAEVTQGESRRLRKAVQRGGARRR